MSIPSILSICRCVAAVHIARPDVLRSVTAALLASATLGAGPFSALHVPEPGAARTASAVEPRVHHHSCSRFPHRWEGVDVGAASVDRSCIRPAHAGGESRGDATVLGHPCFLTPHQWSQLEVRLMPRCDADLPLR